MTNPLRSPVDELDRQLYTSGLMTPEEKADIEARAAEMAQQTAVFAAKRVIGHKLGLLEFAWKGWGWLRGLWH